MQYLCFWNINGKKLIDFGGKKEAEILTASETMSKFFQRIENAHMSNLDYLGDILLTLTEGIKGLMYNLLN